MIKNKEKNATGKKYRTGSAVTLPTIDPAVPLGSPPLTERSSSSGVRPDTVNALIF